MLSFALVSAAVASGTALTKPAENPLRRLSESDPSGGACSAAVVMGLAMDPPVFNLPEICPSATCLTFLVTYLEASITLVEGMITAYADNEDMLADEPDEPDVDACESARRALAVGTATWRRTGSEGGSGREGRETRELHQTL